jgi:Sigma-70 factor, region 1.1
MPWTFDESDDIRKLLLLGQRLGYLTYEMLNWALPDEVSTPETLDRILGEIDHRNIQLIDEHDEPHLP